MTWWGSEASLRQLSPSCAGPSRTFQSLPRGFNERLASVHHDWIRMCLKVLKVLAGLELSCVGRGWEPYPVPRRRRPGGPGGRRAGPAGVGCAPHVHVSFLGLSFLFCM